MDNNNTSYRIAVVLPVDLEEKARDNAYKLGMIKGGQGILSSYIQMLIIQDLNELSSMDMSKASGMRSAKLKRVNITIEPEFREKAQERAMQLGFVHGGKGNISSYIRYLIAVS